MEKGRKGFIVQPGQVAIDFDKPDFAGGTVGVDIPLEINSKFSGHFSLNELRTAFDCRSISDGPEKEFLAFVEAVYAQKEGDCRWAESNVSGGTTVKKLGVKGKISASSEPS